MKLSWRLTGWYGLAVAVSPALAQEAPTAQRWLFESRVQTQLSLSQRSGNGPGSEQAFEVSPGVRLVSNAPRAKGFLDYTLTSVSRSENASGENIRHDLNGSGRFEVLRQSFFVDTSATVSRQPVSVFGPQIASATSEVNQAETRNFSVSPSWVGRLPYSLAYELRHTASTFQSDASGRADSVSQGTRLRLYSQMSRPLGWSLDLGRTQVRYDGAAPDTTATSATATVSYTVNPALVTRLVAGVESNDQLTAQQEQTSTVGAGVDWRPTSRTTVSANVFDRYFGLAHDVTLEHRFRQSVLRFSESRSVVDTPETGVATLGSLYELVDDLFKPQEPDPVARARLVNEYLRRTGLPANLAVRRNFLVSQATRQSQRQASFIVQGQRQSIAFSASDARVSRLSSQRSVGGIGDDLDALSQVHTISWSVAFSHRLTPVTSANLTHARQRSAGQGAALGTASESTAMGLTTALGRRTSGGLQLRHTRNQSSLDASTETALVGNLLHRF